MNIGYFIKQISFLIRKIFKFHPSKLFKKVEMRLEFHQQITTTTSVENNAIKTKLW